MELSVKIYQVPNDCVFPSSGRSSQFVSPNNMSLVSKYCYTFFISSISKALYFGGLCHAMITKDLLHFGFISRQMVSNSLFVALVCTL